jgi:hypothetical protein
MAVFGAGLTLSLVMSSPGPVPEPTAIEARSAGFAIVSRLNRWLLAGAVGGAGALSLVAASSFHGKSKLAAVRRPASHAGAHRSPTAQSGVQSSPSIQPAPPPVAVAPAPAAVVSGGS